MDESAMIADLPSRPVALEVVTDAEVEALVVRHEAELKGLRLELEEALRAAAVAERRLNAHPAAVVIDQTFEIEVLAQTALRTSEVERYNAPAREREIGTAVDEAEPPALEPRGETQPASLGNGHDPVTEVEIGSKKAARLATTAKRPRTVVVTRPAPIGSCADVVGRSAPVDRSEPESLDPVTVEKATTAAATGEPTTAFVSTPDISAAFWHESEVSRPRGSDGPAGLLARIPSRLLIQLGVAIVVVALLMLKLG